MDINWEIVAVISEFVGAVAVVVSLIYVAVQLRQNTRLMRTTAKQNLTESTQQMIYHAGQNADIWVKLTHGVAPSTPEENARMSLLVRAMLRGFESQCYHNEAGLLEDDEWSALRKAMRDLCALPGINKYWLELKPHMSLRLQRVIDAK